MGQETETLLQEMEEENGGKILFRTYCHLLGFSDGTSLDLGGLMYVVNEKLIFEDFEKQPGLLDLFGRKKKKAYEKFKIYRLVDDIKSVRFVRTSYAKRIVDGKADADKLPDVSRIEKLVAQTVLELSFKETPYWYIELLNNKEFIKFVEDTHECI